MHRDGMPELLPQGFLPLYIVRHLLKCLRRQHRSMDATVSSPGNPSAAHTRYIATRSITGLRDSVNALEFNAAATLLALGCDDGLLVVLRTQQNSSPVVKLRLTNIAVTALLWHPVQVDSFFVGYADGGIALCELPPDGGQVCLLLMQPGHMQSYMLTLLERVPAP